MSSNNDFLSSINKISNFFGLTEKRLRAFAEGAARGSVWLVLWAIALASPLFISYFIAAQTPGSSIDDFSRTVIASIIQTAGGVSSFSSIGGALESTRFFIDAALRPTGLTLLLAFFAYKRGRIRQASETTDKGSENTGMAYSLGLGAGFSTLATLVTLFVSGLVNSSEGVKFEAVSIISWVSMLAVLAIPAWLGGLRESNSKKSTSAWVWFYSTLRTFGLTYSILIVASLISVGLFSELTIVYGASTPVAPAPTGYFLAPEERMQVFLTIAAVILYLPTIAFYVITFGMGGNIGLLSDVQGINLFDSLNGLLPTEFVFGLGNFNLQTAIGWAPLAASVALVSLIALIAGTAAAYKTNAIINFKKHFIVSVSATVVSAAVLTYLTTFTISWTNRGKDGTQVSDGELALQSGIVSYGVTAASLILLAALFAVFSTLGASSANKFTSDAFPRVLSRLSFGRSSNNESRALTPVLVGTAVSVALLFTAIGPVALKMVERTWATVDTPFSDIVSATNDLQSGDLNKAKKYFNTGTSKGLPWFPDEILKNAIPKKSMSMFFTQDNSNNEGWRVGQLDAVSEISWKVSEKESIKLNLEAEGSVKKHLNFITHADYKVKPTITTVNVSAGEFLAPTGKAEIKVNGKKVTPGTYNALPGTYELATNAYKLVAASKKTYVTNSAKNNYVAEEKPTLKPEYEKILDSEINKLAKECSKFSAIDKANCFTLAQIYNNRTDSDKKAPSEFFGFQTDSFKVGNVSCEGEPVDKLLSALHVTRERICEIQMTFTLDYFKSKSEVRKLSRQETYNGCPEFEEAVCSRSRTISLGSETVEVRGDKIGSAEITSTVPFFISAMGYLDAKDKFSIVKQFVKPSYTPAKKPVVKPAPVKKKEFVLLGYYVDLDELKYVVKSPKVGDAYAVTPARNIYVWSGKQWLVVENSK